MNVPDKRGVWLHEPTNEEIDVYPLDPVGGILCIWGPDVGMSYTGFKETQDVWDTDEWQGHIPVHRFDNKGPWQYLRPL